MDIQATLPGPISGCPCVPLGLSEYHTGPVYNLGVHLIHEPLQVPLLPAAELWPPHGVQVEVPKEVDLNIVAVDKLVNFVIERRKFFQWP